MIDHIFGKPSPSWKRFQVRDAVSHPLIITHLKVLNRSSSWSFFGFGGFLTGIQVAHGYYGYGEPIGYFVCVINNSISTPPLLGLTVCQCGTERFTPWQLIVSTLTGVYAVRNLDKILGLGGELIFALLISSMLNCSAHSTWTTRPPCKFHAYIVIINAARTLCLNLVFPFLL